MKVNNGNSCWNIRSIYMNIICIVLLINLNLEWLILSSEITLCTHNSFTWSLTHSLTFIISLSLSTLLKYKNTHEKRKQKKIIITTEFVFHPILHYHLKLTLHIWQSTQTVQSLQRQGGLWGQTCGWHRGSGCRCLSSCGPFHSGSLSLSLWLSPPTPAHVVPVSLG